MTSKSSFNMRRTAAVVTSLTLVLASYSLAYNKSWDQGHQCVNTLPGASGWGRYGYDTTSPADYRGGEHISKDCCELLCKICPVYANTGRLQETFTDLTVPGVGPSLKITRTYLSQDWATTLLGRGWMFNFGKRLIITRSNEGEKIVVVRREMGEQNFFEEHADGSLELLAKYGVPYDLVKNPDGTYTIVNKDGSAQHVNPNGKTARIVDKNGNELLFEYDVDGCLSRITNASGNFVDFQLGPNGKIASISDNLGRSISYTYGESGNLIAATDPMGYATQYVYDSRNRLTQITDPRGNTVLAVTYDSHQPPRVATFTEKGKTWTIVYHSDRTVKTDSSGNAWTYFFNDVGIIERVVDPLGNTKQQHHNRVTSTSLDWEEDANGNRTTYTYDADGNITSTTDPLGNTTTYAHNALHLLETMTDPLGVMTRCEYDSRGNRTKIIEAFGSPLQRETSFVFNATGNLLTVTDPVGNVATYAYDAAGNLLQETDPLGNATAYTYDVAGNRIATTDPLNNTTTYMYDANGNLLSVTDPVGNSMEMTYDENGRPATVAGPAGSATEYAYDVYGRRVRVTDSLGHATSYEYDASGRLARVIDANGNAAAYAYDSAGRLVAQMNALGYTTTYGYDAVGNRISVTDANGNETLFAYGLAGRLSRLTYPDGTSEQVTYDATGRRLAMTDRAGGTTTLAYDALGRLTTRTDSDSSVTTFAYDAVNRMIAATNSIVAMSFTYDAAGHVLTESNTTWGQTVTYTYDATGHCSSVTGPDGRRIDYEYDPLRRLVSVATQVLGTFSFTYSSEDSTTVRAHPNGTSTSYHFDPIGNLHSISHAGSLGTFALFQYDRDAVGNIIQTHTLEGDHTYQYDAGYRLVGANHPVTQGAHQTEVFTYDPAGNRTSSHSSNTYEYGTTGVLQSDEQHVFSYDANGRMTRIREQLTGATVAQFQYGGNGRVSEISTPDGAATYSYDALDRLVLAEYQDASRRYVYDGKHVLAEYDGSGLAQRFYVGGRSETPFAVWNGSSDHVYHEDAARSVVAITDAAGQVVHTCMYSAFGVANCAIPSEDAQDTFTGRPVTLLRDFYDFRARIYDAERGRFISPDPAFPLEGYRYGNNDPINHVDPSGYLAVRICVRPLGVLPDWLPWWGSPANHAYLEIGGWSAGYQNDDHVHIPEIDLGVNVRRCTSANRRDSGTLPDGTICECATDAQIESCIKQFGAADNFGAFSWWSHNCGHWVIAALNRCCLHGSIPWHWYGP